jgi:hypothetical protein
MPARTVLLADVVSLFSKIPPTMKRQIPFMFLIFIACSTPQKSESEADSNIPAGFVSLFDGETMTGWRFFRNGENNAWEVVDGTLHCKPFQEGIENKRGDLVTEEAYQNFELWIDWKISSQGNSGIMFRVSEEYEQPYATGPEYQIIDDLGYPGELKAENKTACNYDMHIAENKPWKPVGEWNQTKLKVNGNQVEHWLNGQKVLEYELHSEDWNARMMNSKWKDFPAYGTISKGLIDLQDHGNEVWFKNIFIKIL